MPSTKLYYKVVYVKPVTQTYCSACISQETYQIAYELNTISKKVEGSIGIFVFGRLKDAKEFVRRVCYGPNTTILAGTGEKSKKQSEYYCDAGLLSGWYELLNKHYMEIEELPFSRDIQHEYPGTIFLDTFTPLRIAH